MIDILSGQSSFLTLYWSRWTENPDAITVLTGTASFLALRGTVH
jgi:hypothetical protein